MSRVFVGVKPDTLFVRNSVRGGQSRVTIKGVATCPDA